MEIISDFRKFTFNKIYVIESLPENEVQTGISLYEDLLKWSNNLNHDVYSEYWGVQNKMQFELCLEALYIDTVFGCDPFIHFEIHGSSNFDGLILKSKELIRWVELADMTRKINKSVKNNLIISFATCYSGYFIKAIDITKPSPFHGCIMALDLLTISEIEIRFNSFFDTLLLNLDFDLAIQHLNEVNGLDWKLIFFTSEEAFDFLINKVLNKHLLTNFSGKSLIDEEIARFSNIERLLTGDQIDEKPMKNTALSVLSEIVNNLKNEFLLIEN